MSQSAHSWQQSIRNSLKDARSCNDFFQIERFREGNFPLKIPLEFAKLIDKNNPNDPLLKQVIGQNPAPNAESNPDFTRVPIEDVQHAPIAGLVHKYPNRVLLIVSRTCAIHCQYCFRQNFDYATHDAISNWGEIEQYLRDNLQINEVILSGGDPLSLSDDKLNRLILRIERLAHITTLRIHSRTLVVIPRRITEQLSAMLLSTRLSVVVVFHVNHRRELSAEFARCVRPLRALTLLNQSVLLAGVNDSAIILSALSTQLFALGILPYYLHLLDKVSGAEHFLVADARAVQIHQKLKATLSGYLVPKLVRDNNGVAKVWVG